MYLAPHSNSDRRLGYNSRSPSPSLLAMDLSYNGLNNLRGSHLHEGSAPGSSDDVSPFSSNSLSGNGSTSGSGVSIVHGTQDLHLGLSRRPSPLGFIQPKAFEDEVHNLRCINASLELKNQMLQVQHDTLREAYSALLKAIPGANSVIQDARAIQPFPDLPPLKREDYPNIKFWTKRLWTEFLNDQLSDTTLPAGTQGRGRTRASLNVNVAMRYIELEDGSAIDGDRASEIRKFARAIWVSLGKRGLAPATWGKADVETRKEYFHEMNSRFSELRFCDLDWKSEQVATDNYPSWYTTWAYKESKAKEVKDENEEDIINGSAQSKRSRKPSTQSASKRKKVKNQTDEHDSMGAGLGEGTMESDVVIVPSNIPATTGNTQINVSPVPAGAGLDKGIMESDVVVVAANIPATTGNTQINVSPVPAVSSNTNLLANTLNPLGIVPQDPIVTEIDPSLHSIPTIFISHDANHPAGQPLNHPPPITSPIRSRLPLDTSTSASKDFQITTSVRIPDGFSEKINDLWASSAHMPVPASSTQRTTPSVNSMANSSALPSQSDLNSMANSSALPPIPESMVAPDVNVSRETTFSVNSMAGSIALPSESMVAPGNHETGLGVNSKANSSTLLSKSSVAPNQGAAKKIVKMRPGTSNTARSLCSQEWCKQNPRGTTAEFKNYFTNLSPEALKRYEDLSVEKKRLIDILLATEQKAGISITGPDSMHV